MCLQGLNRCLFVGILKPKGCAFQYPAIMRKGILLGACCYIEERGIYCLWVIPALLACKLIATYHEFGDAA